MTPTKQPMPVGDLPAAPRAVLGVPLPLVTQPLRTALREDQPRVDSPIAALRPDTSAVPFGRPAVPRVGDGPAPEIDLTQHALPEGVLDRRLELVRAPDGERAAAFRVMRHHLLELGRPPCIVVSSARTGEGKTTTALNLALALAECGRARVLLLETHLRHPQLAGALGLVPPWCFAEQLAAHRHQPHMPWSFVEIPQLWLHVGALDPRIDRAQLLDGPAFAIAMDRLRAAGYDHIVIDAPPVLGSADVNLIADAADTVVLAVRARTTTTRDVRAAIDQLGAAKVAGTVIVDD